MIPAKLTTIGPSAFADNKLTGLDLSKATSLVEIGNRAFLDTVLQGTLVIPSRVTTICSEALWNTKPTGLDLSKANSLVEIGNGAFYGTGLAGTLVIPATEYGRIDRPIRLRAGLRRFHGGALACV